MRLVHGDLLPAVFPPMNPTVQIVYTHTHTFFSYSFSFSLSLSLPDYFCPLSTYLQIASDTLFVLFNLLLQGPPTMASPLVLACLRQGGRELRSLRFEESKSGLDCKSSLGSGVESI